MRTLLRILAVLLALPLALLLYLLVFTPRVGGPIAAGAKGNDWEVRSAGGTPYLVVHGVPVSTHFEASERPRQPLDGRWELRIDDDERGLAEGWHREPPGSAGWEVVEVPSTINAAAGPRAGWSGISWFRRSFRADDFDAAHPRALLTFEGVLLRSTVWLNGQRLGAHEGGYTPFSFDVANALRHGEENVIVVRSDSRPTFHGLPPRLGPVYNAGWAEYAGIYRPVFVERLPERHVFKAAARVSRQRDGSALLGLDVLARNERGTAPPLTVQLWSPRGTYENYPVQAAGSEDNVAYYSVEIPIDGPRWWSPGDPALYDVELTLGGGDGHAADRLRFATGLREIRSHGTSLLLNGSPIFLRGISKHEDDPLLGATQTAESIRRDLALVRDMNANYVRTAHYPHDVRTMLAARDMGLLLSEEIPLYQAGNGMGAWLLEERPLLELPLPWFGLHQLAHPDLLANAQRQLIEMIERDRNNPAIILWSVANETFTWQPGSGEVHAWLADVARAFDPTRLVTMAEVTLNVPFADERRHASRGMDVISINTYDGWYFGEASNAADTIERLHRVYPDRPLIVSEFGAGAAPGRSDTDGVWQGGNRVFHDRTYSEEYQAALIEEFLGVAREREWIAGTSPWVFADFYCPWFGGNPVPYTNLKGLLGSDRRPKLAWHRTRAIYGQIRDEGR